jgi:hypothetical protein
VAEILQLFRAEAPCFKEATGERKKFSKSGSDSRLPVPEPGSLFSTLPASPTPTPTSKQVSNGTGWAPFSSLAFPEHWVKQPDRVSFQVPSHLVNRIGHLIYRSQCRVSCPKIKDFRTATAKH